VKVLKLRHLESCIRNARKVLKRGAGEGRVGSVGPIVYKIKQYYKDERNILHTVKRRG
jgi:hypothetical protein